MSTNRQLFKEDYTDIVKKTNRNVLQLSYYEKIIRLINDKKDRHVTISDYEMWMFSKLAYSNDGINQQFVDAHYNVKFHIEEFISETDGLQLYVIISRLTKDVIIVFRGTDELVDWLTNIQILSSKKKQFDSARLHLERLFKKYNDYHIYFCGHSLGGALAQYMYVYFYLITKLNIIKAVTFNSAGIRYKHENGYIQLPIYNYIVMEDIVGNATGYHYGKVYNVLPKEVTNRFNPLKLFTHTLDQFTFRTDGSVNFIE